MQCPECECEDIEILKSKGKKKKELLLQCKNCGIIFKEKITIEIPEIIKTRVVVSEYENSWKSFINLSSDEYLEIGTILYVNDNNVEVTSIEDKLGVRKVQCPVVDINTIWAKSLETPSRIGISIDNHGTVYPYKAELKHDFRIAIGDITQIRDRKFEVYAIKSLERNMKKGFAYANVIKRVYGKLLSEKDKRKAKYDLTPFLVKRG